MYSFADPYIPLGGQTFLEIMQPAVFIAVCRYNTIFIFAFLKISAERVLYCT